MSKYTEENVKEKIEPLNLNKKITLKFNNVQIICYKILYFTLILIVTMLIIHTLFCFNLEKYILLTLIIIIIGIAATYKNIFKRINNMKIEITNSNIYKTNFKGITQKIGNIKDITSYANQNSGITVLKNEERLFYFMKNGNEDNEYLINYLATNYEKNIYHKTNIIVYIIMNCITIMALIIFLPELFHCLNSILQNQFDIKILLYSILILILIIEMIKISKQTFIKFKIIDNKFFYQTPITKKELYLSEIDRVIINRIHTKHVIGYETVIYTKNKTKFGPIPLVDSEATDLIDIVRKRKIKIVNNH